MDSERRLAILLITPDLILEWCKPGKQIIEVIQHALPEDSKIFGAGTSRPTYEFDADLACFKVIFESASLPPVPVGARIPVWPAPVFRKETTKEEAKVFSCPKCGMAMFFDAENSSDDTDIYRCSDCAIIHGEPKAAA